MQILIGSRVVRAALASVLAGVVIGAFVVGVAWSLQVRATDSSAVVDVGSVDDFADAGEFRPVLWVRDDFFLVKTEAGEPRALYAYPLPTQVYGRTDCAVVWFEALPPTPWTEIFRDPCTGATFRRDGTWVFGPSSRGLDQFPVMVKDGRILVDTRRLRCAGPGVCKRL